MSTKRKKLSYEILGICCIGLLISLIFFSVLLFISTGVIEEYIFNNDIVIDNNKLYQIDLTIFIICLSLSVILFVTIFLVLFNKKLSYIKQLTSGITQIQKENYNYQVPVIGSDELTTLAESINFLIIQEKQIKELENKLKEEKDELIRNLSHDIRTPLTSIISYTEILSNKDNLSPKEINEYFSLILSKAKQIKDLTNILLDYKRELIKFDDVTLLFQQLIFEFKEMLEKNFKVDIDLSMMSSFSASFDVNELRRIFDNLITNIQKYADPNKQVELKLSKQENNFIIIQKNYINNTPKDIEQNHIGINSIKRILQNYNGEVLINKTTEIFEITLVFPIYL